MKGNLHLYGNHISTNNGRFVFEGNKIQYIYGDGNIGNFEINNITQVRLTRDMIVNNTLTLTSGILNIGPHRLTATPSGQLAGSTFNQQTMIASSGSIADRGLRLFVPTGASTRLFPIGVITENKIYPCGFYHYSKQLPR